MTTVSDKGVAFIAAHEGVVLRAYRDSAGVVTIGTGFTMRSRVFAAWARGRWGRALRLGDIITRVENDVLLKRLLDEEYGPPVMKVLGGQPQHRHDGSTSVTYNCGAGTLKDRWAKALAAGKVAEAATLLRSTRITAGGRRLQGLVNRRAAEARLLEIADYGKYGAAIGTPEAPPVSTDAADIKLYQQQLKTLGLYAGELDGIRGPATRAAIVAFQRQAKLTPDGIVGPATRAALQRAVSAVRVRQGSAGAAPVGAAAGGAATHSVDVWPLLIGAGVAVLVITAAWLAWRYRGLILSKLGLWR